MDRNTELMDALRVIKKYCEQRVKCQGCIMLADCEKLKITVLTKHPDL